MCRTQRHGRCCLRCTWSPLRHISAAQSKCTAVRNPARFAIVKGQAGELRVHISDGRRRSGLSCIEGRCNADPSLGTERSVFQHRGQKRTHLSPTHASDCRLQCQSLGCSPANQLTAPSTVRLGRPRNTPATSSARPARAALTSPRQARLAASAALLDGPSTPRTPPVSPICPHASNVNGRSVRGALHQPIPDGTQVCRSLC